MASPAAATTSSCAAAVHLLTGLAAIVLGIVAFAFQPAAVVLTSVALLVLGGSLALSGSAVSTMMLRLFQHQA